MIGRSVLSQSKERIHKNFPRGFTPTPPRCLIDFNFPLTSDALFFTNHIYFIFLNLRVHDNFFDNSITEWRMLDWSQKFLGIKRLDARSPVGRHFLFVVPNSCYSTNSFILRSIHKRGVGRIYSQSRGRGPRENFLGLRPRPHHFSPLQ